MMIWLLYGTQIQNVRMSTKLLVVDPLGPCSAAVHCAEVYIYTSRQFCHPPRWFSGIIRPSGFLTQEYTLLEYGRGPAFDSRLGPFCCRHPRFRAVFGLEMIDESIWRRCRCFRG